MTATKVLIIGCNGQLGRELCLMADSRLDLIAVDKDELDITKHDDTFDFIVNLKPDLVINSAAYTAVDGAEEDRELAFQVNGKAPAFIAKACNHIDARLIHISTDFVFDGEKNSPILLQMHLIPWGFTAKASFKESLQSGG